MKIECGKDKLKEVIALASKITSKNTTLPVLNSILLTADNNTLKIRATNLDIGVEFTIPVKVYKTGVVAIPGNILNNTLINLLNNEKITLEVIGNNLEISIKNNTTTIKSEQFEDFPTLPKIQSGESFIIPSKKIINGLKSVWYSASVSDIKPEISSVFIYQENNLIIFVSTDSFRLAEKRIIHKGVKEFQGIILPFKNINEIIRVFDNLNKDINIIFNKNQISFSFDGIYLTSRIIDGVFPDYKQIIPKEYITEVVVLKQDIIDALKSINVFSDKFNKVNIKIDIKNGIFELFSKNDLGENNIKINTTLSGDDINLCFNYKYIMDCFQSITSDSITLQFSGDKKPMIIKEISDNSFTYLVMPINK
ncbi:MAG TPA: DNA polymerase III subunit beta [Ignavibacteria bacterium]|nr:DNA polymerase III subunit beta [Ignavibacteria bacterium]